MSFTRKNYIWASSINYQFKLFEILHCKCWEINFTKKKIGDPEHLLGLYFLKSSSLPETIKNG
jgi:hypothetical protein